MNALHLIKQSQHLEIEFIILRWHTKEVVPSRSRTEACQTCLHREGIVFSLYRMFVISLITSLACKFGLLFRQLSLIWSSVWYRSWKKRYLSTNSSKVIKEKSSVSTLAFKRDNNVVKYQNYCFSKSEHKFWRAHFNLVFLMYQTPNPRNTSLTIA